MRKTITIFIFLFLLASSITAVPPLTTIFSGDSGLEILVPAPRYLQTNTIGATTVHVFNASDGMLLWNTTEIPLRCYSLIQYPNGSVIAQVNATPHSDHFDFTLNLTGVEALGEYGWVIHCNTSEQGGYSKGSFELTTTGNENEPRDNSSGIAIVIFILSITAALFVFSMKKEIVKNKYANIIIRRSLLVLGIYLMILNSAIMATLAASSNLPLVKEMFFYMNLIGFMGYPAMMFLMLSALFQTFRDMKQDKKDKRTGDDDY